MTNKRVHFASTNLEYAPQSPTPSPTYSSSSLPSSSGPSTPPSAPPASSPNSCSPLVLGTEVLHPELAVHSLFAFAKPPPLDYDLSLPPSSVTTSKPKAISSTVLEEAATTPPLPCITLVCAALPWTIVIPASSKKPSPFVTVEDVFNTLHRALRLAVTPAEYENLPSREVQSKVDAAYMNRYERIGVKGCKAYEDEKIKGVKRIDFLLGKNRFFGLERTAVEDAWEMKVGA